MSYITEFPYQKLYISGEDLKEMFRKLKGYNFKERMVSQGYWIRNLKMNQEELTFLGKPWIILVKGEDYFNWRRISEVFQDECRMKCHLQGKVSPEEYFYSHIKEVNEKALREYDKITPKNIREVIYNLGLECTSHNPAHIMAIIELFNIRSMLDCCSGWGDRLIGSMAKNIDFYCGVDPNPCLHPNYRHMIKFFGWDPKKIMMIQNTIEGAKIPRRYFDGAFTSPPYFDLEIYSKDKEQSSSYGSEKKWFHKFFKVAINKTWRHIRPGGVMCFNINQKNKSESYIRWMLNYIASFEDSIYLGVLSYANEDFKNPQPIWIWRKIRAVAESKNLYVRRFKSPDLQKQSEQLIATIKDREHLGFNLFSIITKGTDVVVGFFILFPGIFVEKKYKNNEFMEFFMKKYDKDILIEFLKKINKKLYISVPQNKVELINFYEHLGFKFLETIKTKKSKIPKSIYIYRGCGDLRGRSLMEQRKL